MESCSKSFPLVSVIIPIREPGQTPISLDSLAQSSYPADKLEVLVVSGANPSAQRNFAAQSAQGDILYFIDDDSVLDRRAIETLVSAFEDHPEVSGIGGPSVGYHSKSTFRKCVGMAMASVLGFGPLRYRYYPSGCPRIAGEEKLILANFGIRNHVWRAEAGFDLRLYPNEENEFIRRLELKKYKFLYHPGVIVYREPRQNLLDLAQQAFRYGAGRVKHLRLRSHPINAMMLGPVLLFIYSALIVVAELLGLQDEVFRQWLFFAKIPLLFYIAITCLASVCAAVSFPTQQLKAFLWCFCIFPTLHLGYGSGMAWGVLFGRADIKGELNSIRCRRMRRAGRPPSLLFSEC